MEILGASFSLLVVLLRDLCAVKKKKKKVSGGGARWKGRGNLVRIGPLRTVSIHNKSDGNPDGFWDSFLCFQFGFNSAAHSSHSGLNNKQMSNWDHMTFVDLYHVTYSCSMDVSAGKTWNRNILSVFGCRDGWTWCSTQHHYNQKHHSAALSNSLNTSWRTVLTKAESSLLGSKKQDCHFAKF